MTSPLPPSPPATTTASNPPDPASPPAESPPGRSSKPPRGDVDKGNAAGLVPPPLPRSSPRRRARKDHAASSVDSAPASTATSTTTTTKTDSSASTDDDGKDPLLNGPPAAPRAEKLVTLDKTREFVTDALQTVTNEANTRDRLNPQQIPDLWLTDADDDRDLATPVARIIHRRLPTGTDELGNPDLGDAIEAGIALWFYVRKQIRKLRDWRRVRRELEEEMEQPDAAA